MNVLVTTYFQDFSRYFRYLEESLHEIQPNTKFDYLCYYPSSFFYLKKETGNITFIANESRKIKVENINSIVKDNIYKGINLDEVILFNYRSQSMFGLNKKVELKKKAIIYIEYFDQLFKRQKYDLFISSGDTRMVTEIAVLIAKKYNVKTLFFEQGPFRTTMLDSKGVNKNISFCDIKDLNYSVNKEKLVNFLNSYKAGSNKFIFKDKFIGKLDLLYLYPPKLLRTLFPIEFQTGESFFHKVVKVKIGKPKVSAQLEKYPEKFIALVLQVPVDAQMIYHSPIYNETYDMLQDVYNSLPSNYYLVVREHPGNRGNYDSRIYEFIKSKNNVLLINDGTLDELLTKAQVVIVNNSTVGMEALAYYKPVITLGEAYYNREGVVYHVQHKNQLKTYIEKAIIKGADRNSIRAFLYTFIFEYLYHGHFQDKELISGNKIAEDIINYVYEN